MSAVINLDDHRRQPVKATPKPVVMPRFYCLRCDGDRFHLQSGGEVHCAACGSRMRNLVIGTLFGAQS